MIITYPSREFDEAVAAVCHGNFSEVQARGLNCLLRENREALDEYIIRVELHSHLASSSDLFDVMTGAYDECPGSSCLSQDVSEPPDTGLTAGGKKSTRLILTLVPLFILAIILIGRWWSPGGVALNSSGSAAVASAMLDREVAAVWAGDGVTPQSGDSLAPGDFHLISGLVQILFYDGARVAIEGPAEFTLINSGGMSISSGRLIAEVAPQAIGFRVVTPQATITDLGTAFCMEVTEDLTELHVIEGRTEVEPTNGEEIRVIEEGAAVALYNNRAPNPVIVDTWRFASLFELQKRSLQNQNTLYENWRQSGELLSMDESLLVRLDFEDHDGGDWKLSNSSRQKNSPADATKIGCQWTHGRWPGKKALEFRGVNDRVRLMVPGESDSLTLSMWIRVQGLDRSINSLFMSDGFEAGTIHWSIRHDGVMGLTLIGRGHRDFEIMATPPVVTLERLGKWIHLAVVVDGPGGTVKQFFNGEPVSIHSHRIRPPFHIGKAEIGNWNAVGFPVNDPFMIRNFSGAIDEFCLFKRALGDEQINRLYNQGNPQPNHSASNDSIEKL